MKDKKSEHCALLHDMAVFCQWMTVSHNKRL